MLQQAGDAQIDAVSGKLQPFLVTLKSKRRVIILLVDGNLVRL
jgi:hypothetical protein